ncbi:MAG: Hpt domain-containing protein [Leptotrichiaceae bacterium]|nr:Hpt domain-containing protein [Leptotrichiaceae bacterium]
MDVLFLDKDIEVLMPNFRKSRLNELNNLKLAIENKDLNQFKAESHKIKGVAGSFGWQYLSKKAEEMENLTSLGNSKDLLELIKELEIHVEETEIIYVD